jgi:hypothetical protein
MTSPTAHQFYMNCSGSGGSSSNPLGAILFGIEQIGRLFGRIADFFGGSSGWDLENMSPEAIDYVIRSQQAQADANMPSHMRAQRDAAMAQAAASAAVTPSVSQPPLRPGPGPGPLAGGGGGAPGGGDVSPFAQQVIAGVAQYNLESNFWKLAGTSVAVGTGLGAFEVAGGLGVAQLTTLSAGGPLIPPVARVLLSSEGSIRRAVAGINLANLSQSEAVHVIRRVTEISGRRVGGVVDVANGAKVVIGVREGVRQPLVFIGPDGMARFGSATVSFARDALGTPTVSDIVLP